jgi:hypothetical protein
MARSAVHQRGLLETLKWHSWRRRRPLLDAAEGVAVDVLHLGKTLALQSF